MSTANQNVTSRHFCCIISDPAKIINTKFYLFLGFPLPLKEWQANTGSSMQFVCYFLDVHINMSKVRVLDEQSHMAGIAVYF